MLRLSKKADYALIAITHLAAQSTPGTASAREIAERYDIPLELLAKVLQHLARRGFLASHMGAHGGYYLARPADAISVAEVIEAIDGPLAIAAPAPGGDRGDPFSTRSVSDPLWRVKDRIVAVLQSVTFSEMARSDERERPLNVRVDEPGRVGLGRSTVSR